MRKVLILLSLLLLITPVSGISQEIYSKAKPSDEGIYEYFSKILKDGEKILKNFIEEDRSGVNNSKILYKKIKLIKEENQFYSIRGVKSNVSRVLKPFFQLSSGEVKLTESQQMFLQEIKNLLENEKDFNSYLKAKTALISMKLAANEINESVKNLKNITLWNDTTKLTFDVSELTSLLKEVYDLISFYETLLRKFEFSRTYLLVTVSERNPYLNQDVTIYVYSKNVTNITIFVDNSAYKLKVNSIKYRFHELGEHTIYAEGYAEGKIVKSNIVRVYVKKIPTELHVLSKTFAFITEKVPVTVKLNDYYGNPIEGRVLVEIEGKRKIVETAAGSFSFNVTKTTEGPLSILAHYPGDSIYESSNASATIYFSRYPVYIHLKAENTKVYPNESIYFEGKITGLENESKIIIFVNTVEMKILNCSKFFNFTLKFPFEGNYEVFAYFPGDRLHKPAKSNIIKVVVSGEYTLGKLETAIKSESKSMQYFPIILVLVVLLSIFLLILKLLFSKKERIPKPVEKSDILEVGSEEVDETTSKKKEFRRDVKEAYKFLFNVLTSKYSLKKSLTPRKLLKALKNEPFSDKLEEITNIHEKVVYGRIKLSENEEETYFKLIEELLEVVY